MTDIILNALLTVALAINIACVGVYILRRFFDQLYTSGIFKYSLKQTSTNEKNKQLLLLRKTLKSFRKGIV